MCIHKVSAIPEKAYNCDLNAVILHFKIYLFKWTIVSCHVKRMETALHKKSVMSLNAVDTIGNYSKKLLE